MIKTLEKKKNKVRLMKVACPRCKSVNEFACDNELALVCKKCGQALGFSIFH